MNHIAFNVPAEKFEEYYQRLQDKGIDVTRILDHDNSPSGVAETLNDDVFVRSVYFFDPDGACLEFASWTRALRPDEALDAPNDAAGVPHPASCGRMAEPDAIRALAIRLFDCIEEGDAEGVADCYAPELVVWHNFDGLEPSRADNLATLAGLIARISERR